jgi:hypothetical protein
MPFERTAIQKVELYGVITPGDETSELIIDPCDRPGMSWVKWVRAINLWQRVALGVAQQNVCVGVLAIGPFDRFAEVIGPIGERRVVDAYRFSLSKPTNCSSRKARRRSMPAVDGSGR